MTPQLMQTQHELNSLDEEAESKVCGDPFLRKFSHQVWDCVGEIFLHPPDCRLEDLYRFSCSSLYDSKDFFFIKLKWLKIRLRVGQGMILLFSILFRLYPLFQCKKEAFNRVSLKTLN